MVFILGGVVPMAIATISYFILQESLNFLATKSGRELEIKRIVRSTATGQTSSDWLPAAETIAKGTPATELFAWLSMTVFVSMTSSRFIKRQT